MAEVVPMHAQTAADTPSLTMETVADIVRPPLPEPVLDDLGLQIRELAALWRARQSAWQMYALDPACTATDVEGRVRHRESLNAAWSSANNAFYAACERFFTEYGRS